MAAGEAGPLCRVQSGLRQVPRGYSACAVSDKVAWRLPMYTQCVTGTDLSTVGMSGQFEIGGKFLSVS